ncbi:hypothetical protein D920_02291 [Enterococcus faecalis 13-SD-W-01]|nr:hypothetical protein D920_02291 [Enterococcus faecalis 13-SD-W-01]
MLSSRFSLSTIPINYITASIITQLILFFKITKKSFYLKNEFFQHFYLGAFTF